MNLLDFALIAQGLESSPSTPNWIQLGMLQRFTTVLNGLLGSQNAELVIIEGCVVSVAGDNYTITAGTMYYQGTIYSVAAGTVDTDGITLPQFFISPLTYSAPQALSSSGPINVLASQSILFVQSSNVLVEGLAAIANWNQTRRIEWVLKNTIERVGKVEMYAVDQSGFDGSGLGQEYTEWEKWAICNGANGTVDMGLFVPIGVKAGDANFGAVGDSYGEATHLLTPAETATVDHTHKNGIASATGGGDPAATGGGNLGGGQYSTAGVTGGAQNASVAHNNIQPSKAFRYIQKIA